MDKNTKVPFNPENSEKCFCNECPIEISSQCAKDKKDKIEEEKEIMDSGKTKVQKES